MNRSLISALSVTALLASAAALPAVDAYRESRQKVVVSGAGSTPQLNTLAETNWARIAYAVRPDTTSTTSALAGLRPVRLVERDFNQDGRADVLTVYQGAGQAQVSLRFTQKSGGFSGHHVSALAGRSPTDVVAEDFNFDGRPDVLTAFDDLSAVSLLESTGAGTFGAAKEFATGTAVQAMTVADFDQDGYADILGAGASPGTVILLRGNQHGFELPVTLYTWPIERPIEPVAVNIVDVDHDGLSDVAVTHRHGIDVLLAANVYEPTPLSATTERVVDVLWADFNDDRMMDYVMALANGELHGALSDQDGHFARRQTLQTGTPIKHITTAQLNEDGYTDLVLACANEKSLLLVLNDGAGGFGQASRLTLTAQPDAVTKTRLNKDGIDDLVIAGDDGGMHTAASVTATITVNSTRDVMDIPANGQMSHLPGPDGRVCLREAIVAANNTPGPQTIVFNIRTSDSGFDGKVFRLQVTAALPELSGGGTTIDGSSQTLFTGDTNPAGPEIFLDGRNAGRNVDGLSMTSSLNVIQGLIVSSFSGSGVKMLARAVQNILVGCYIGTNETGTEARPNGFSGVVIAGQGSQSNLIGGTVAEDRNVISGNGSHGITIQFPSFDNRVWGNYIGTTAAGDAPLPNLANGVYITSARENLIGGVFPGASNVIAGNGRHGISIESGLSNQIQGNLIGTDATGSVAVPNGQHGVVVSFGSDSTLIGGTGALARNVISGNGLNGVEITQNSQNTRVSGNLVGTNQAGTVALPNGVNGVLVTTGATQTLIGGLNPQSKNVIAGNKGSGVALERDSSLNNLQGNYIGLDASGAAVLANGGDGVTLRSTTNNTIGGREPGAANVIAGNRGNGLLLSGANGNRVIGNIIGANVDQTVKWGNAENGILVQDAGSNTFELNTITASGRAGVMILGASLQNRISKNAIYDNRTLGIDLNGDGVTQNDPSDLDSGPNGLRNFPIITGVSEEASGLMVSGFLPAPMASTQTIELFRAMPSPFGYGEGGQFLGEIRPGADGQFSIMMPKLSGDAPLATALANGDQLTATAIDIAGNTSEFSPNFIIGIGDTIAPTVQLFSPNGGELVNAGETMTVRWQSFDNVGVVAQDVLLSTDNGRTFSALQTNLAGAIQQIQVSVPMVLETAQAVVCVVARDGNRNEVRDCSDSPFVIFGRDVMPPSVRLASPNGGEIIAAGQPYTITWQSSDDRPGMTCTVLLSTDGGLTYTTLVAGLTGVSSYTWHIPATLGSTQARIRVVCRDAAGLTSQDESDANFAIDHRRPEVRLAEPNGGTIVLRLANNPVRIQWTSADDVAVASHDILLSLDGGETFSVKVAENLPGSAQSYDWIVPRHIRSGKAMLRIISKDFVGRVNQDDSDRTFILFRP